MKKILFVLSLFIAFGLLFSPTLFAEENDATSSPKLPRLAPKTKDLKKELPMVRAEFKEKIEARKEEAKEKVCEVHAKAINKRAKMLTQRAARMAERFDKIALGVEEYYTEKMVPEGKTLSNYDELVKDIADKKSASTTLIDALNSDANSYTCDTDDPKKEFETYRKDMQAVISGLADYRKSVKSLLVAVKGLKGEVSPSPVQ